MSTATQAVSGARAISSARSVETMTFGSTPSRSAAATQPALYQSIPNTEAATGGR
jgi:hypothetical protein